MNRVIKYDILRIVACFSVVMLHVSGSYLTVVDIFGKDFLFLAIYNGLTRFSVPVFFMLSGLFLASPQKDITTGNMLKRIFKLLLCFYIWSGFYAFQGVLVAAIRGNIPEGMFESAMQRFLFGHSHMWFIQTLTGFYLLLPIARQICENRRVLQYYLLLWVIFRFLLPQLINLFGWGTFSAWINKFAGLDILVGYFGYFILGYYINEENIKKCLRYLIYAAGIGACFLTIFLTIRESKLAGVYIPNWTSPGSINVLIMSVAVIVFFKYNCFAASERNLLWIKISNYTFFIYMFHMFVIDKLNLMGITVISFFPAVSVPIMTIFVFLVSLLGAFGADHIPIVKKLLMLH